jgi:hypothetical protein
MNQKSISLPTALLAAATGIAFFWASIFPPSESQSSSVPVSFVASPQLSGPVYTARESALFRSKAGVAARAVGNALRNLKQFSRKERTRFDNFDCLSITALEDSRGVLIGDWPAMPTGINSCLIRFVESTNKLTHYVVILAWQELRASHQIAENVIIR